MLSATDLAEFPCRRMTLSVRNRTHFIGPGTCFMENPELPTKLTGVAATALADRMLNNRSFNPEMVGQIVGQFQVPFVGTGSHIVVFNLMEGAVQGLLIKHAQDFLSHREQAMVLLLNVLAQQRDVGTGVCCETGDGRAHIWFRLIEGCHHRPDVISTFVVLHEHAANRL